MNMNRLVENKKLVIKTIWSFSLVRVVHVRRIVCVFVRKSWTMAIAMKVELIRDNWASKGRVY